MISHVELDILSGNPNPSWQLDPDEVRELMERLESDPTLMDVTSNEASDLPLGYRGYIVTLLTEPDETAVPLARLPQTFRIRSRGQEAEQFLLRTSEKSRSGVTDTLREHAAESISTAAKSDATRAVGVGMSCAVSYLTSSTDFWFWNDPQYIARNNCYAFGGNYRSNTFPQPGRKARTTYDNRYAQNLIPALRADGWKDSCLYSPARNISVAAVIWPGVDFHFFRRCSGGWWCHKPGTSPARNTDNSGRLISIPEFCNRGPYTQFVGYVYADSYMQVQ